MSTRKLRPGAIAFYAVPIGATTITSYLAVFFFVPLVTNHPLLLVACSPVLRNLILVASRVDVVWLFAVVVPRHYLPDPFFYLLGRQCGHLAIEWVERNSPVSGRAARLLERLFAKIGPVALLILPDPVMSTLAGAAKVPFATFTVFNLLGTIGYVILARRVGDALAKPIAAFITFLGAHWIAATAVIVVATVLWSSRGRREVPETPDKGTDPVDP